MIHSAEPPVRKEGRESRFAVASSESANLDVLRAMAVFIVLVGHLLQFVFPDPYVFSLLRGFGQFGVLIFFVHTSLVLMMSMERLNLSGKTLFAGFYIRRAFRIYPLSIATVLIVWMLKIPRNPIVPYDFPTGSFHLASNLMLTMNLTYSPVILGPLWSLPYEMQMYLLLPFFFLFLRRCPSLVALLGIWVLALPLALAQPHIVGRANVIQYVPCFLGGIVAFHLIPRVSPRLPFYLWPMSIVAIFLAFHFWDPMLRGWIPCLVLGLIIPLFREVKTMWLRTAAHAVARYSYGIYLSHLIVIWLCFFQIELPGPVRWLLFATLMVTVPFVAFHALERPLISVGQRLARRVVFLSATPARSTLRTPPGDFSSVTKLYFLPFAKAARSVIQKLRSV